MWRVSCPVLRARRQDGDGSGHLEISMNLGRAIVAGTVGGTAMTGFRWMARQLGFEMNTELMLGAMITAPGSAAWLIGFAMHLIISALIALA